MGRVAGWQGGGCRTRGTAETPFPGSGAFLPGIMGEGALDIDPGFGQGDKLRFGTFGISVASEREWQIRVVSRISHVRASPPCACLRACEAGAFPPVMSVIGQSPVRTSSDGGGWVRLCRQAVFRVGSQSPFGSETWVWAEWLA